MINNNKDFSKLGCAIVLYFELGYTSQSNHNVHARPELSFHNFFIKLGLEMAKNTE